MDVGAHVGQSAKQYLERFPAATIHCFEPSPESYRQLVAGFHDRVSVIAHNVALGDRAGTRELRLNERSSTNSLLEPDERSASYIDSRQLSAGATKPVEVATLDSFCADRGIERIDILKVDVQGAELLVLQGGAALLNRSAIAIVYVESQFAPLYRDQADFWSLSAYLHDCGYVLYGLFDLCYGRNGLLAWADALWLAPSLSAIASRENDRAASRRTGSSTRPSMKATPSGS